MRVLDQVGGEERIALVHVRHRFDEPAVGERATVGLGGVDVLQRLADVVVTTNLPSLLNQSGVGRSRIHQCSEPQWFSTMSLISPMPRLRASTDSRR